MYDFVYMLCKFAWSHQQFLNVDALAGACIACLLKLASLEFLLSLVLLRRSFAAVNASFGVPAFAVLGTVLVLIIITVVSATAIDFSLACFSWPLAGILIIDGVRLLPASRLLLVFPLSGLASPVVARVSAFAVIHTDAGVPALTCVPTVAGVTVIVCVPAGKSKT